jgi:hypothetical protein
MTDTKPNLGRFGVFGRGAPPTLTLIDRPVCATARRLLGVGGFERAAGDGAGVLGVTGT